MNTSGNIDGILAPIITGLLVTFYHNKFESVMCLGASLALLGVVILWTIDKVEPIVFKQDRLHRSALDCEGARSIISIASRSEEL